MASSLIKYPDSIFSRKFSWNSNVDLNDFMNPGIYGFSSGCTNAPEDWIWVIVLRPSNLVRQISFGAVTMHTREFRNGAWNVWKTLTNS